MHIFSIPYSSCLCLLENRLWLLAYFTYRPDVPSIATPHPAACRTRWALSETECPAGRNMLFVKESLKRCVCVCVRLFLDRLDRGPAVQIISCLRCVTSSDALVTSSDLSHHPLGHRVSHPPNQGQAVKNLEQTQKVCRFVGKVADLTE